MSRHGVAPWSFAGSPGWPPAVPVRAFSAGLAAWARRLASRGLLPLGLGAVVGVCRGPALGASGGGLAVHDV
eukprot:6395954-Alexandrium_andersonii.AAC.1